MNTPLKVASLKALIISTLTTRYGQNEARWIARILFQHFMQWDTVKLLLHDDYELTPYMAGKIWHGAETVAAGTPVQYVTGDAPFYGMTFKVNPAVLIPRPETAQLVDIIVDDFKEATDLKVLDCGTGSGCIAIALARNLPFSSVSAIDISDDALKVAEENNRELKTCVRFFNADILTLSPRQDMKYDIIVSNPPYIMESERKEMETHVLDHEPATALFVPDSDPLRFYRAITSYAARSLRPGGKLYFEINPLTTPSLESLLHASFEDVTILPDTFGKQRFAIAGNPLNLTDGKK